MTFRFSGTLMRFVDYSKEVTIDAPDLREALTGLCTRFPSVRPVLYDGSGRVRETHRLFLNDEQLAGRDENPALKSGDRVEVLTAIAGG